MQNLQEIFNRIQETKRVMKDIRASYKDALTNSQEYSKILEQYKEFQEKKKKFENDLKSSDVNFARLDELQNSIKTDFEIISDIAFNQLLQGEPISIADEKNNQYEPVFTVKFKKK